MSIKPRTTIGVYLSLYFRIPVAILETNAFPLKTLILTFSYKSNKRLFVEPFYFFSIKIYQPSTHAKINGATMVASLSTMNFGV